MLILNGTKVEQLKIPHIALMLPIVLLFKRYLVFITHKWLPFKLIIYCLFNEVSNQVALDKK